MAHMLRKGITTHTMYSDMQKKNTKVYRLDQYRTFLNNVLIKPLEPTYICNFFYWLESWFPESAVWEFETLSNVKNLPLKY